MIFKDKEIICKPYYEEEIDVYTVSWTESGRDEDGIYVFEEPHSETFTSLEKAQKAEQNLIESAKRSYGNMSVDRFSIRCSNFPTKQTRKVFLSKEDKLEYLIALFEKNGYTVSKKEVEGSK